MPAPPGLPSRTVVRIPRRRVRGRVSSSLLGPVPLRRASLRFNSSADCSRINCKRLSSLAEAFWRERLVPKKEESLLPTQGNQECFAFHPLLGREGRGQFAGGASSSEGGGLLARGGEN